MESYNEIKSVPKILYIEITSECDLRCKHCHIWMNKEEPDGALSLNEKMDLIKQFKEINPIGVVGFTGGEAMIKEDEFFKLSTYCKENGVFCVGFSNTSFMNERNYERVLNEGPTYLQISLDSHIEKIHDYIRGRKGAFKHTVDVLKNLMIMKRKRSNNRDTKIFVNCVLFDQNISLCDEFVDFIRTEELAEGVTFSCLIPTLQNRNSGGDTFFEKHLVRDKELALKVIENISQKYKNDPFMITKKDEFDLLKMYLEDPDTLHENYQVCNSAEKNMIVDLYGNTRLCFHMNEVQDVVPMKNVRKMSLQAIWASDEAKKNRNLLNHCRRDCGTLSCHRKENIFDEITII